MKHWYQYIVMAVACLSSFSAFAVGPENHIEVTAESVQSNHQNLQAIYRGVALVQIAVDRKNVRLQSGFFYDHDKVMTSVSVDSAQSPDACSSIFVTPAFVDKKSPDIPRQYKCVEDILIDPTLGFRAFRIENADGTEARADSLTLDSRTMLSTTFRKNKFEMVGFTVDRSLMYSTDCEVVQKGYQPDPKVAAARPSLVFAKYAWMRGECVSQSGMNGAPILFNGKVVGIASGITRQNKLKGNLHDELVWVQMYSILNRDKLD